MSRIAESPIFIEIAGNRYEVRTTDEPPTENGRTYRMVIDGDKRLVLFHNSVSAFDRTRWLAEAAGLDPATVTWRLSHADERVSRPLPMAVISH